MDAFIRDVRYALTTMRRNRGFAAAGLLTLALGIGATTAVFSVVYGVLLRPLPYPSADRRVRVWEEYPGGSPIVRERWISNHTFYAWMERPRTIDVLGGYGTYEYTVSTNDENVRMFGAEVSPPLLAAVGAIPIVGRLPAASEADPGSSRVIVLSERLWRDLFGGDPAALGRSLSG
jgi:putative ABC transport system permease protein